MKSELLTMTMVYVYVAMKTWTLQIWHKVCPSILIKTCGSFKQILLRKKNIYYSSKVVRWIFIVKPQNMFRQ